MTVAHGQTTFQKIFGSNEPDAGYSVLQTTDSGFVFTGFWSAGGIENMFLIKTDALGNTLWTKMYEDEPIPPYGTAGYSVINTLDNGYAIAGYNIMTTTGMDAQMFLVKTNSLGDTLWQASYGEMYVDAAYYLKQTNDSGFIMVGYTDTAFGSVGHILVIKTDVNGNSLWSKTYGFGGYRIEESHSILQTIDGGFAILGYTSAAPYPAPTDIYLFKTNSNGDTLWTKNYGGVNVDVGYSIQNTQDNGFIIAASTMSMGAGGYDAYLIKTDGNGIVLWQKTFGGLDDEWGNYVNITSDGGFILVGSTQSFSAGNYDVYLVKTDSLGNQQWDKTFGGINADYGYSVQQTFDGGYIIVGIRNDNIYLIKTDGNGNVTGTNEIDVSALMSKINIYPNPFSTQTTLQTNLPDGRQAILHNATLTLYNCFGQTVKELKNISEQTITFNRGNLPSGLYFIRLAEGSQTLVTEKLLITDK